MGRHTKQRSAPDAVEDDEALDASEEFDESENLTEARVDRWLWAARCFKSRSAAGAACDGGHVKVNGSNARASKTVIIGDQIDVVCAGGRRILKIAGLGLRRGSAEVASSLFVDLTPPPPPKEPVFNRWERGAGRPTKRDRRAMDKMRGW